MVAILNFRIKIIYIVFTVYFWIAMSFWVQMFL